VQSCHRALYLHRVAPLESRRLRLCAAAAVALATFAVLVPANWVRWPISEDAIEYAAIARNWVAGRGFVNPVMLSFSLDDATPPVPGLATRAPVVSLLLSIPIALGASLRGLGIVHQAWAALVVAGLVLAARRSMSLPAAVAYAVTFAWSTGWMAVTQPLVTEVSAVGAFLLVLVTARCAARSAPGALLCAALVWLAWLTRPPLGLLVPVVWLAHALEVGPRAALRSRPLWLYVGAAAGLYAGVELGHRALTGYAPYAQYDVMLTSLDIPDVARYETLGGGALEFVRTHGPEVRHALAANLQSLVRVLFTAEFYRHLTGVTPLASGRRLGPAGHDQQHRFKVLEPISAPDGLGVVEEFGYARTRTDRPIKVTLPGPFTLSGRLSYGAGEIYRDRIAAAEAFVPILAAELERLVVAGATYIQVDEPSPAIHPEASDEFATLFNAAAAGVVGRVHLAAHLCFGNFFGRPLSKRVYRPVLRQALAFDVGELVLEWANREMAELDVAVDITAAGRHLSAGVIDVKNYYLETADDVAERIEKVLAAGVPEDRLSVVPDCGFSQTARWATKPKLAALVLASSE